MKWRDAMNTIIVALIIYIGISLLVATMDISAMQRQENDLMDVPYGDLEFYEPKSIMGIHNFVFLPSFLFIYLWIGFVAIVNKLLYNWQKRDTPMHMHRGVFLIFHI